MGEQYLLVSLSGSMDSNKDVAKGGTSNLEVGANLYVQHVWCDIRYISDLMLMFLSPFSSQTTVQSQKKFQAMI